MDIQDIAGILRQEISQYEAKLDMAKVGRVLQVGDGIGVAGLSFYLGWFHFSSGSATTTVRMPLSRWTRTRSKKDKDKAGNTVQDLGQQAKDKVATTTQKAQE